MNAAAIVDAVEIPASARIGQRVPKKVFLERVKAAADRRRVQDGVEELIWAAALKPSNIGVPAYRDESREYLEIIVVTVELRPAAKLERLNELIHRAVPYPVLLVTTQSEALTVSLAHKRLSQAEAGAVIADGPIITAPIGSSACLARADGERAPALARTKSRSAGIPSAPESGHATAIDEAFLASIALAAQPRSDLHALYHGWITRAEALLAARVTGHYMLSPTESAAAARRAALESHARLDREIAALRARAAREKQISRRVEINMTIHRLTAELAAAKTNL
jgi:hypothetical protein